MDDSFGAAGDDHIGSTGLDHPGGIGDALGARSAGADRGVDSSAGADLQTDVGCRAIGHDHGNHVGRYSGGPSLAEGVVGGKQ